MELGAKLNPWKGEWEPLDLVYRARLQGGWQETGNRVLSQAYMSQEDQRKPDHMLSGVLRPASSIMIHCIFVHVG